MLVVLLLIGGASGLLLIDGLGDDQEATDPPPDDMPLPTHVPEGVELLLADSDPLGPATPGDEGAVYVRPNDGRPLQGPFLSVGRGPDLDTGLPREEVELAGGEVAQLHVETLPAGGERLSITWSTESGSLQASAAGVHRDELIDVANALREAAGSEPALDQWDVFLTADELRDNPIGTALYGGRASPNLQHHRGSERYAEYLLADVATDVCGHAGWSACVSDASVDAAPAALVVDPTTSEPAALVWRESQGDIFVLFGRGLSEGEMVQMAESVQHRT